MVNIKENYKNNSVIVISPYKLIYMNALSAVVDFVIYLFQENV
jgi:hypothetical protein